jgi:hypothetical protein
MGNRNMIMRTAGLALLTMLWPIEAHARGSDNLGFLKIALLTAAISIVALWFGSKSGPSQMAIFIYVVLGLFLAVWITVEFKPYFR